MASVQRFEELEVWKLARELARGVYRAAESQPLRRDRVMLEQMKRAAISISSNIAEGFERGTRRQHIEFCYIAKASAGELRSQVIIARDVALLGTRAANWLSQKCEECSRRLAAYIASLERNADSFRGLKYRKNAEGPAA